MSEEVLNEVNNMLFDVWEHLIAAGPGSSHLEMMDIILKNERYPLWKYMKASISLSEPINIGRCLIHSRN